MKPVVVLLIALGMAGSAFAKLPAPTPEQAAKAEEAKAKAAWGNKVGDYKLCMAQDRVAARYLKEKGNAKSTYTGPACQDPGPFAAPQAANTK